MKNIHLLPTEKPSKLFDCFGKLSIGDFNATREDLQVTNQHIYITSDEEIKEGDAVIHNFGMGYELEIPCDSDNLKSNTRSKIILTTDQDLIADGVQSIDDEFLEWFVKNPSCNNVEVKTVRTKYFGNISYIYKIIIPQEEPKQDEYTPQDFINEISWNKSKQETLEEAAEKYARKQCDDMYDNEGLTGASWGWETSLDFIAGAEWQAKKSYSEEDLKLAYNDGQASIINKSYTRTEEWFEQNKKK